VPDGAPQRGQRATSGGDGRPGESPIGPYIVCIELERASTS
jgi:hypothetical protein